MCGIVGAVAQRDVSPILLEGLKRLEYRGYDSAGMAVVHAQVLSRMRRAGKVGELAQALVESPLAGGLGIAHTRWATHGIASEGNAHPHICNDRIAVVHNGIIENFTELKARQLSQGFRFTSQTDTEVIAHQIVHYLDQGVALPEAVRRTVKDLEGAYAIGVIDRLDADTLIAARHGSPLVVGMGIGEYFIASDVRALLPVTQQFMYLENSDLVVLRREGATILDMQGRPAVRAVKTTDISIEVTERGAFRHFMLKEIYEQPQAIADTLAGRISQGQVPAAILGPYASAILEKTTAVQIVACGTSYHAGLVARYWFEDLAGIPCHVEIASEFRYRRHVVQPGTLFVTISQSGETADTLAALMQAKEQCCYVGSLALCNVPESSLMRESDLTLMTHAGPEIGVASTKAFTAQLVALLLLVILIGRQRGLSAAKARRLTEQLERLPAQVEQVLGLDGAIAQWAEQFALKHHALFLGRGVHYPIAMEGALKLKEISYIHAEAYAAGELKHGPLALIDDDMPVVAVAPNDELLEKLKSNLEEVRARGGRLYVFADAATGIHDGNGIQVLEIASTQDIIAPILFTVPLQLLAYHAAVLKGTDVDQPRNLAKSVTVE